MKIWRSENGFTLTELLIAMAAFGLLLAAMLSMQEGGLRAYANGSNRLEVLQNGRIALAHMEREIREASSITTAGTNSIAFMAQDGVTVVTYALNGNTLERSGVALVGGVEALTFVYRGANDAPGASATDVWRIDVTIRTRTEEAVEVGNAGDTKYQATTSLRLRNTL